MEVTIDRRLGNNVEVIEKVKLYKVIEKPISGEWGSDGDQISVIRSTNFTNEGRLNLKEVVKRNIEIKKVSSKKLRPGDIIIEKSGGSPTQPVGRVVYFDLQGTYLCNNFTSILRPKSELIYPKYLHYQLFSSHKFGMTNGFQNKTTGIINLKLERYINELEIPLPSLSTQQKIADILDTADQLRQYNKQLIEKYDALTQSLFLEMFGDPVKNEKGWEKKKLMEVCTKITDGTHKTPTYLDTGVIFLSAKNIKNFELNCLNPKYISTAEHSELNKRCNVEIGDILITKSGSLGMAAKVEFEFNFSIFESLALIKYLREKINGVFLLYFLNTKSTQQQYNDITKGVGVKHLHLTDLRKLNIIVPPFELQNQFSERVQMIEAQKQQAQEALAKSEDLFQSLLQRAFKGELK